MILRALALGGFGLSLVLLPRGAQAAKKPSTDVSGVVNLNQASAEQLKMLPGMKEAQVKEIIAHRQKKPFARVEELVQLKGFSKKQFEKWRPHLTVSGETTLKADKAHRTRARKKTQNH